MKLTVLLQIFFIWSVVIWVYKLVARRDGRAPIDDIGIWWLLLLMLYATLPPLAWLVQGGTYSPISGRLFKLQPSIQEVEHILYISIAYIVGFCSVFCFLLKRVRRNTLLAQAPIGNLKLASAALIILFASIIDVILIKLGLIRTSDGYVDSYAALYEAPRAVRQLVKIIGAVSGVAKLVLIVGVFQTWPKYRFFFICYLFFILVNINPQGGRGAIVTSILAMVVAWHVLIRPIPSKRIFFSGFLGLFAFLLLGIWRNVEALTDLGGLGFEGIGIGEFDSLWGNAIELLQAKKNGGIDINIETRFGELLSFIPSQLLWFEKISLNDWYLNEFYPGLKDTGGGLVFGTISQAIIGGGLFEATIRGAIVGSLAGWLMKLFRTPTTTWWRFPLHLYLLIGTFAGIRETTFIQFGDLVQTWLIAPFVIVIIEASLSKRSARNIENEKKIC